MQPLRRPWNPASTCRMRRSLLRGAALGLAMAAAALATDHPIEGDRLLLTDPPSPARRAVRSRAARDPAIDPRAAADPRSVGATLEIAGSGAGDGASGTISLDPGRWTGLGRPAGAAGYRWDDRAATNGIRRVMFRKGVKNTGMLVVTGGGVAWPYRVTQPQVAIDVRFTVGTTDVYCAHFTSFSRNAPPRVLGSDAPPPSSCGSIPPAPCANGLFCVNYTTTAGNTVIARYQVSADPDVADAMSEHILITIAQPFANHNGGDNVFGPDGFLYVGMGDGGSGGDPNNNAQNDASLLGKLLRIDPVTEAVQIWAKGLRNPWRFSFDRGTGDLYIADVGQDSWEEVDVQPAPTVVGVNYGWHIMEGRHCFNPMTGCNMTGLTLPVLEYDHSNGCSITGGFVYRGCRMPDLRGTYFYSDYCSAFIRTFRGVSGGDAQNLADRTADLAP